MDSFQFISQLQVLRFFVHKDMRYFIVIFFIFFAACIETDVYLPSFPDMMTYFSVSEEKIQQLLTWNFLGLCLSGLFYGPLSDSFGRKKPILAALGCFLAGSVLTVFASTFSWMLAGRVLQGLGSGGCFTLGTAILFDVFKGKKAVQVLNRMNTIVPFMLASAPMIGGYLNYTFGFRSNFLLIGGFVLFSLLICVFFFEETLEETKPFDTKKIAADFKKMICFIPFWQLTLIVSLLFAGYLAFLAQISLLFVLEMNVSKALFPFYQASVLIGYLAASLCCSYAIEKWGVRNVKFGGIFCSALGVISLCLLVLFKPSPIGYTIAMIPYSFGFLWVQTPYVNEIMNLMPEIKGVAASLLTSARLLITAGVVGAAGSVYDGTIIPYVLILSICFLVVIIAMVCYEKNYISTKSINPSSGST